MNKQESLIGKIGAPKWPWKLDKHLVDAGKKVFNKKDPNQGNESCADCHGEKDGKMRSLFHKTWATPILDVGTDSREIGLLSRTVQTGVLEGTTIFPTKASLKANDLAVSVLGNLVGGSIIQHYLGVELSPEEQKAQSKLDKLKAMFKKEIGSLEDLVDLPDLANFEKDIKQTLDMPAADAANPFKYESRVLKGIWATAPYLHNGSVQSLTELLTPAEKRLAEFKVGPEYDPEKVGLAANQTKFNFTLKTTGCDDRNSGNSRCGHDYGTSFSDEEKKALLEYLKSL